ncbi:hypothetical protein EVA_06671 [gut metagenome]|uniref:Uncharacterized protein n=1 Tax=gut metagenome TaxID=749906 RepID=J9GD07_9ZZZZ
MQLTILRINQFQRTGYLLHSLNLSVTTNSRYGNTRVYRRHNTGVEQVTFKENLTVCNGNNVGWNICRYVTCLCFNNWKGSEGTATMLFV